ncbi:hypothetical protein [Mycobacterium kubicae]|uniref:hypothetical protein n=1 Tax=Mycobacterium kubicae TaxID=120959 RepID=UPI0010425A40|nr:hypothetical protein [Mycobacterium kubicae]
MRQPSVDATQHAPNTDPTLMRPNTDPILFAASSEARGQAPWPAPPAPRQDAPAPRQDAPPAKPKRRRLAVMLLSGAAVLTVIGVVAAVLMTGGGGGDASHQPSTTEPNAAPDNSGPFTGEYTADFGPKLSLAGQEVPNSEPPDKETWVSGQAVAATAAWPPPRANPAVTITRRTSSSMTSVGAGSR